MQKGFIQAHIRRGNRIMLNLGIALCVVGFGLAWFFGRWFPAILGAVGVWALASWLRRTLNPTGHAVYKNLAKYGDVKEVVEEVNREFAGAKVREETYFGQKWLAQGDAYGVTAVPWTDVVWLYSYTTKRNGRTEGCWVKALTHDGSALMAPTAESRAPQLMRDLHERAPWAEVGYTRELTQEWEKTRADFLRRVDARRHAMPTPVQTHAVV